MELSFSRLVVIAAVGLFALGVMLVHPAGPALVLVTVTPIDGIFWKLFRYFGNVITLIPILIFFMRTSPARWGQALFGSKLQLLVGVWVLLLLISHLFAIERIGPMVFLSYSRKLTYFLLFTVLVWYWRDDRYIGLAVKLFVSSYAIYVGLSMMDFYLGIQVLPVSVRTIEGGAAGIEFKSYLTGYLRFSPPGIQVNRFGGTTTLFVCLAIGWFQSTRNPFEKVLTAALGGTLMVGLLASASRSGVLGLGVGLVVLAPMAFRLGVREMAVGLAGAAVMGFAFFFVADYIGSVFDTLATRMSGDRVAYSTGGRLLRWVTAIQVWATSPLWGVGDDMFKSYSAEILKFQPGGKASHNAYMKLLAETGLIGVVPFIAIFMTVFRAYLTSVARMFPTHDFWRPYFFAGFMALSTSNVFNDYMFDRMYWMTWAYAAVLSLCATTERAQLRRERQRAELETLDDRAAPAHGFG